MLPTDGVDHWPCRMFLPTELSSHASSPVTLSTATMVLCLEAYFRYGKVSFAR